MQQYEIPSPARGYIEGYYGRLLSFSDRHFLLDTLVETGAQHYLYAPKEDICHRYEWRRPYDKSWLRDFSAFCTAARENQIMIWAGIAPGLDFDFSAPDADLRILMEKAESLRSAGADGLVILFDDISDDVSLFDKAGLNEGECHGRLASLVREKFSCPVWLVPRLYADEIEGDVSAYAQGLRDSLHDDIAVMVCGRQIVSRRYDSDETRGMLAQSIPHQTVIWDNLYCNDYCPRRLFVGEYTHRPVDMPVLLNGTGMVHTDRLLLGLYAGLKRDELFCNAGVPEAFDVVAPYFNHPVFSGQMPERPPIDNDTISMMTDALDRLLWSWKSPLAREWYPYLFGLKQDLHIAANQMQDERIAKTQNIFLSHHLIQGARNG